MDDNTHTHTHTTGRVDGMDEVTTFQQAGMTDDDDGMNFHHVGMDGCAA